MESIFITGQYSIVVISLIKDLKCKGYKVYVLVENISDIASFEKIGAIPVFAHSSDIRTVVEILKKCITIYYLPDSPLHHEYTSYDYDTSHFHNIAMAAKKAAISKIIFLSSFAAVANELDTDFIDESYSAQHNSHFNNLQKIEEFVFQAATCASLKIIVLRPAFLWGTDVLYNSYLDMLIRNKRFLYVDGGKHYFSTCHIKNLIAALIFFIDVESNSQVFFVTDGESTQVKKFIDRLLHTNGIDICFPNTTFKTEKRLISLHIFMSKLLGKNTCDFYEKNFMLYILGKKFIVIDFKLRDMGYENQINIEEGFIELNS